MKNHFSSMDSLLEINLNQLHFFKKYTFVYC